MFKSKRAGLVRRLWRSRLVTESDGRDGSRRGEGRRDGSCGRHSGKLHRHEQRPVTHTDPALGLTGEAVDLTESPEREEEEQPDDDRAAEAMCVSEHRGARRGQEGDGRTVTCCLFGEWDIRPRSPYWGPRKDGGGACQCAPRHTGLEEELASTAHAFLKRLKEKSLDTLVKAVETRGGIPSECVMVPSSELRLGAQHISPQDLLCKVYRWSDLPLSGRLKTLSHCQSFGAGDGAKVCCNPYHYSRLCGPESPPPPYSLSRSDEHKPLDSNLSYTEPVPPPHLQSASPDAKRLHRHWYLHRLLDFQRTSLSLGTGLCLGQLHANAYHSRREDPGSHSTAGLHGHPRHGSGGSSSSSSSGVQQIRSKIGHGIVLSREPDGVWLYNRSKHPVFVHSPTLDPPRARVLSVKRVMPGFSLKVFDYEHSSWMAQHGVKPECQEGPWDPHSVRISFAKGWGPCYSRQFITSCPCWLEVLLNNHR
ncbi:hypothetical protein CesoFtcFv8_001213 [Champsocephalus esox]|uniref:Mothers against decapentaplegic homolog n=1 Tax=Champsocephalus esox TaxID=159716 RepID=A0AAN8D336_9TELE|nr:hypothetical protein CesoFtcFv8_001213 [Champsocephalus esox]